MEKDIANLVDCLNRAKELGDITSIRVLNALIGAKYMSMDREFSEAVVILTQELLVPVVEEEQLLLGYLTVHPLSGSSVN